MSEEIKKVGALNELSDDEMTQVSGAVYAKTDKWWDADRDLSSDYRYDVDNPYIVFDDASCKVLGRYATKDLAKKYAGKFGVKAKEIDRDDLKAGIDAFKQHCKYNSDTTGWTNPIFK